MLSQYIKDFVELVSDCFDRLESNHDTVIQDYINGFLTDTETEMLIKDCNLRGLNFLDIFCYIESFGKPIGEYLGDTFCEKHGVFGRKWYLN